MSPPLFSLALFVKQAGAESGLPIKELENFGLKMMVHNCKTLHLSITTF